MQVALCYNKKPESNSTLQGESEDADPPPNDLVKERYAEFDDDHTIKAITEALAEYHDVYLIEADETSYFEFLKINPDIVFNIAEGFRGPYREAFIPSILEFLNIPYTGSDPCTLLACLDKSFTKRLLTYHGIPTPEFQLVPSIEDIKYTLNSWRFYPCIVKPVHEGSSIGVWNGSIVESPQQLTRQLEKGISRYKQPAIIERLLLGREFTIGILGNRNQAEILPLIEICFDHLPEGSNPIYSYEAKWIWDTPSRPLDIFKCPAQVDKKLFASIKKTALTTYKILGCRDWARIDLRLDEDFKPNILEVNPLPGVLPDPEDNSCMPKAAREAGLEYNDLILKVLEIACERYKIKAIEDKIPFLKEATFFG